MYKKIIFYFIHLEQKRRVNAPLEGKTLKRAISIADNTHELYFKTLEDMQVLYNYFLTLLFGGKFD